METSKVGVLAVAILVVVTGIGFGIAQAATSTLRSWDTKIDGAKRFKLLGDFNNEAVLDTETGLVWEQSPSLSTFTWANAHTECNTLSKGNRWGWRLPTFQELASLVDESESDTGTALPSGNPFSDPQVGFYWSTTTTIQEVVDRAWVVDFHPNSFSGGISSVESKANTNAAWCVRGGNGVGP